MIVSGILLSIAYFLYKKFVKDPANKDKNNSGSPKGKELQHSAAHQDGYDQLDVEDEDAKARQRINWCINAIYYS